MKTTSDFIQAAKLGAKKVVKPKIPSALVSAGVVSKLSAIVAVTILALNLAALYYDKKGKVGFQFEFGYEKVKRYKRDRGFRYFTHTYTIRLKGKVKTY